jgi:tRNA (uracil-5-)-methyltransferase TRM9
VHKDIVSHLLAVNRQFYQTFGLRFSEKRQRAQPGVMRVLASMPMEAKILDLGCGNGEFACQLAQHGHRGGYIGLDFSPELLAEAQVALQDCLPDEYQARFELQQVDLSSPTWASHFEPSSFDFITAFAVLHHIPGEALRCEIMHKVHQLLVPGGRFIHSVWQFLNSPRLAARIQLWESVGLSEADVDPGDYLLDWRHGGAGLRYVHHFNPEELATLAEETGFTILESFHADGQGGRLGLYQTWSSI